MKQAELSAKRYCFSGHHTKLGHNTFRPIPLRIIIITCHYLGKLALLQRKACAVACYAGSSFHENICNVILKAFGHMCMLKMKSQRIVQRLQDTGQTCWLFQKVFAALALKEMAWCQALAHLFSCPSTLFPAIYGIALYYQRPHFW